MANPTPQREIVQPTDDQVVVGTVVGTHGYDGRVRIEPETDNPERYAPGSKLTIAGEPYVVRRSTRGPGGILLIVKLEGLDSREAAAALVHQPVVVDVSDTPPLPEGSYYHYQLLDMTVVDTAGVELGKLTEVIATGSNDVYVVTNDESEIMVPALAYVVVDVDVDAARMTVDLPEGIEPRPLKQQPTKKKRPFQRRRPRKRPAAS